MFLSVSLKYMKSFKKRYYKELTSRKAQEIPSSFFSPCTKPKFMKSRENKSDNSGYLVTDYRKVSPPSIRALSYLEITKSATG